MKELNAREIDKLEGTANVSVTVEYEEYGREGAAQPRRIVYSGKLRDCLIAACNEFTFLDYSFPEEGEEVNLDEATLSSFIHRIDLMNDDHTHVRSIMLTMGNESSFMFTDIVSTKNISV